MRVSYWSIRKPLIRKFRETTCFRKHLNELSLKHMYISVSLLKDISRNVHNIDYTRDMSWEEYFWIFEILYFCILFLKVFPIFYFLFVGFSNFVFCFFQKYLQRSGFENVFQEDSRRRSNSSGVRLVELKNSRPW